MTETLHEIELQLDDANVTRELFGNNDVFLKRIEEQLDVSIIIREVKLQVVGEQYKLVELVLQHIVAVIERGIIINERDVIYAVKLAQEGKIDAFPTLFEDEIIKNARGNPIRVYKLGQKTYIDAIARNVLVLYIVPTATVITYYVVVKDIHALLQGKY